MGFEVIDQYSVPNPLPRETTFHYVPITQNCKECGHVLGTDTPWFKAPDGNLYHIPCFERVAERLAQQYGMIQHGVPEY